MNKPGPRSTEIPAAVPSTETVTSADTPTLPFWPEPADSDASQDVSRVHVEAFYRQAEAPLAPLPDDAWPALLHRYRRIERIPHAYPLFIPDSVAAEIQPLQGLIEERLASSESDGDESERLKRDLFRLEARLRAGTGSARLSLAWDQATEAVKSEFADRQEASRRFERHQQWARDQLAGDGVLVNCEQGVARHLLDARFRRWWPEHSAALRDEIDAIIRGLDDILRAEFEHSDAARDPEHLRDAVGTADAEDLDFDRLSDILTRSRLERPLPEGRHARIEQALKTLKDARPLFGPEAFEQAADLNLDLSTVHNHIREAARRHARRMDLMAALFRDAEIGRLEIDNRYREARHDAWFAQFGPDRLGPEQRLLCPPVLLAIDGGFDHRGGAGDLMSLLMSGIPVKLLIELGGHGYEPHPPWVTRLADLARSLNRFWVTQVSAADPEALQAAMSQALIHPGPAVLVAYTGLGRHSRLPGYLDCAATLEARAVPAWCHDPAAGPTQAERMRLLDNPAADRIWSSESFELRDAKGDRQTNERSFTLADLLSCDRRLADHFLVLPNDDLVENLMPLEAFLDSAPSAREGHLPVLIAIRENGEMLRVVPDRWVVAQVLQCAEDWRALQEFAGIGNSHALRMLSRQQAALTQERDDAIEEARRHYEDQLDRDIGELTREIVSRIADGMLGSATGTIRAEAVPVAERPQAPEPSSTPGSAEPAESAPDAEAPDEAPEEDFALDDPYIDTPLCTSCDDCTKLNPALFAYDDNKQAYIKDPTAGTFKDLVQAAEKCPVGIIHPGKPANPDEPDLEAWIERAKAFQ